jgi:hypothetical protein
MLDAIDKHLTNIRGVWIFFNTLDVDDAAIFDAYDINPPLSGVAIPLHDPKR